MNDITSLILLVAPAALSEKAGHAVFERGEAYFKRGAVCQSIVTADAIEAIVQGTDSYRVVLHAREGALRARCNCPHAQDGYFCKHAVAVGLAWAARLVSQPGLGQEPDAWSEIERYLLKQDAVTLTELLLDVARRDARLHKILALKVERNKGFDDQRKLIRQLIDVATDVGDYVPSEEVSDLEEKLDDILDSLAAQLAPETSIAVMELLEYGMQRIVSILDNLDDEGGDVPLIAERMGELHVQACSMSATDPVSLAERLFHLETGSHSDLCSFDPQTYDEVLGKTGREHYRALANAMWSTIAPRTEADGDMVESRWKIARLMKQFARHDGNIESIIDIELKDLSSPGNYLRVAELWKEAGKLEVALEWAERGIAAFPSGPVDGLSDFLIDHYADCRRAQDALHMMWARFEERPWLESYKRLATVAQSAGQWESVRERALAHLDAQSGGKRTGANAARYFGHPPQISLRVSIALWEEDLDGAWRFARMGQCGNVILRELADKSAHSRPDDAIGLYRDMVPHVLERTSNSAYAEAMELVKKIGLALDKQGRSAERLAYLNQLRAEFKRKRNFIALLDQYIGR